MDHTRDTSHGFETVKLANEFVSIVVIPGLGAKIVSLVNQKTGREWMWTPHSIPKLFQVPTGTPFGEGPFLGADECFPTVAACRWKSRDLPDHGEIWTEPWELDESQGAEECIKTSLRTSIYPFSFERTINLDSNNAHFSYRVQNLSDEPLEYVWAFHPMMRFQHGDRIILPESCRQVQTEAVMGDCQLGKRGDRWDWPRPTADIDLSLLDLAGDGRAVKLFTEPLTEGYAAIANEDTGERLSFIWDPAELDTLGIWINRGGLGGFHHVALEPTNGAPDSLETAVEDWKRFGSVDPGEMVCWRLTLQLSSRNGEEL